MEEVTESWESTGGQEGRNEELSLRDCFVCVLYKMTGNWWTTRVRLLSPLLQFAEHYHLCWGPWLGNLGSIGQGSPTILSKYLLGKVLFSCTIRLLKYNWAACAAATPLNSPRAFVESESTEWFPWPAVMDPILKSTTKMKTVLILKRNKQIVSNFCLFQKHLRPLPFILIWKFLF